MTFPRRSATERVLARHRFKRISVGPYHQVRAAAVSTGDDEDDGDDGAVGDDADPDANGLGGLVPNLLPETTALPADTVSAANTVANAPVTPHTTVLPAIGTARTTTAIPATTVPAVTTTASSVTVPKVVATPQTTSSTPVSTSSSVVTTTPTSLPSSNPQTASRGATSTSGSAAPDVSAKGSGSTASQSSHAVPSAAIGATVAVLAVILIGLAAFFVRKRHQRRRAIKRNTWGAGLVPSLENKRQTFVYGGLSQSGRSVSPYGAVPDAAVQGMSQTPTPQTFGVTPPQELSPNPNAAYGAPDLTPSYDPRFSSPLSPFVAPSVPVPSIRSVAPSVSAMSAVNAAPATHFAVVARTFIPSLPDELHISNGEQIRVISAYDDGWALCANTSGEQGVVPLECLERHGGGPVEMQLQPQSEIGPESNRTSRRISSLSPHTGTY